MADPKQQLLTFPLNLGMDNVSFDESVQPVGPTPMVVESRNTRFTKVPGVLSKAPGSAALSTLTAGTKCGGVIPCGALDSSVVMLPPSVGNKRIAGTQVSGGQNEFFPMQVETAGQLPNEMNSLRTPAVCYDAVLGATWYVCARTLGAISGTALYVTAIADDGRLLLAPQMAVQLAAITTSGQWCGLSSHGANGVVLWYNDDSDKLVARTIAVAAGLPVLGTVHNIGNPANTVNGTAIALAYDPADPDRAYIAVAPPAGNITVDLLQVAIPALTHSTLNVATAAWDSFSLQYVSGTQYGSSLLMVTEHAALGLTKVWRFDQSTAFIWQVSVANLGQPSVSYQCNVAFETVIVLIDSIGDCTTQLAPGGVSITALDFNTGAVYSFGTLWWYGQMGRPVVHREGGNSIAAIFAAGPMYAPSANYAVTDPNFVDDTSAELFRVSVGVRLGVYFALACPVARLCVDDASHVHEAGTTRERNSNSLCLLGDKLCTAFAVESPQDAAPATVIGDKTSRYVNLSVGSGQPSYALTSQGTAIVGGALPMIWDGVALAEALPLRLPKIVVTATGGNGGALTGDYLFAAVVSWKDAQGQVHRSPPSRITAITLAAQQPVVYVSDQPSYRNGITQPYYDVTIYASEPSGTVLYAQPYEWTTATLVLGWRPFETILEPEVGAWNPAIYSDNSPTSPLASFCPGAVRDLAVISDRAWVLAGERRARAYYTCPAVDGVFPSFSPDLFVDFPASAGLGVAVSSWKDAPVFFTETGIWTIAGDGPDALLNPPLFSAPQQIADVQCTSRLSVLKTPVGILFQAGNRYAMFGDGITIFPNIEAAEVVGTALFRDQHEAVLFLEGGVAYVFNYQDSKWSTWHTDCLGGGVELSSASQAPGRSALFYSTEAAQVRRLDPDTVSTTAQVRIETGWTVLGGPQDDSRVDSLLVRSKYAGPHGVQMTLAADYQAAQPVKTWSLADTLSCSLNDRYDLHPEPKAGLARAFKLVVQETDAAGEALQLEHVTLQVLKTPGIATTHLRKAARK